MSTVANVGGLAIGPLAAGLLATSVPSLPRLIYLSLAALLVLALAATWRSLEVRPLPIPRPRYRPQRLAVPAAARAQFTAALTGDFLVFTVYGVFAGLASVFLSGSLHRSSPTLAGPTVFIAFGAAAGPPGHDRDLAAAPPARARHSRAPCLPTPAPPVPKELK